MEANGQSLRTQLNALCQTVKKETTYGTVYISEIPLQGISAVWDVTRIQIPFPKDKEDKFTAKYFLSPDGLKRFYKNLEDHLDNEIDIFREFVGKRDETFRACFAQYASMEKIELEDGGKEYYFIAVSNEDIYSGRFIKKESTSYLGLLLLGHKLCQIARVAAEYGIRIGGIDIDSLAISEQSGKEAVVLSSLIHASRGGKVLKPLLTSPKNMYQSVQDGYEMTENTEVYAIANFLWTLANGYFPTESANPKEIPRSFPDSFIGLLTKAQNIGSGFDLLSLETELANLVKRVLSKEEENFVITLNKKNKSETSIDEEEAQRLLSQIDLLSEIKEPEALSETPKDPLSYPKFNIKEFFDRKREQQVTESSGDVSEDKRLKQFERMCLFVKDTLDEMDANEIREEATLNRQKMALLGYPKEVEYYKAKIAEIVNANGLAKAWKPKWYSTVTEAIYGEILGFSGISNWITGGAFQDSVSCKIIGDRIFYRKNGVMELQAQRISKDRRELLKRTLLLLNPRDSLSEPWQELYTANEHLRVTMYNEGVAKPGQDVIIFRRYILKHFTFEEQARRGTIPDKAIDLFKCLSKMGVNICFTGPVESAKSTMLQSYQALENPKLEAVSIESDDETQYHVLMPTSPIIQFCPDESQENSILDRVKRSDANYIVVGESRSGKQLQTSVEAANMGTRRLKTTFHNTQTVNFAFDVASKIASADPGADLAATMVQVAQTFNYIVEMTSLPRDRGQKRVKGIWEMRFDSDDMAIYMHQICKYVFEDETAGVTEHWEWNDYIGPEVRQIGMEEAPDSLREYEEILKDLTKASPNKEETKHRCVFLDIYLGGKK